jgi:UDP-N-acetylmuramoyl-tripeptide--D-alanyl-D-alanine ligase
VQGRLQKQRGKRGSIILDDTYNANPDSVIAAIDVLARAARTKFLVLGDMGEVGAQGPQFHREIGRHAREAGIERLLTAGVAAIEAAVQFGEGAEHFASVDALAAHVVACAAPGTTILVKGSRFMRMERVADALTGGAIGEGRH